MNKVILMGRLTRDPETRYTQSAEPLAVTRYALAVNKRFKKEGEPDADFINCVAFGKGGEFIEKYFKKGMLVCVSGRLSVRNYEDQNGQKRTMTEVITEEHDFAESKSTFEARSANAGYGNQSYGNQTYGAPPSQVQAKPQKPASTEPEGFFAVSEGLEDEDLPF